MIVLDQIKNGKRLGLPMNDTVKNLFMELSKVRHIKSPCVFTNADGSMIKGTKLQDHFKRACQKAGLMDVVSHTLRHSAASFLVQAGVDLYVVDGSNGGS
ncbi:MAG: tyrosine-type recombinase/integrase [Deltaproteobacteria bacterium]|nr:tyrosine-type recombinase/integrase [Deltaproteobacteria bacterium]MCL5277117.1 tyrosine-type recombinase/integrase [Deltaproteobacteria bacterium]